jgi:hypothetical protein
MGMRMVMIMAAGAVVVAMVVRVTGCAGAVAHLLDDRRLYAEGALHLEGRMGYVEFVEE